MTGPTPSAQVPRWPACLLDPHREVVAFTGRDDAIDALLVWCRAAAGDDTALEEALAIRRELAGSDPVEQESELRELLIERAPILLAAGRRMEYLETVEEVGRITQRMRIRP
jgi:hypothetical protein